MIKRKAAIMALILATLFILRQGLLVPKKVKKAPVTKLW